MAELVLSLFPGIGLLDMAFESEGFCVVRSPDLLWGGDVRRFHVPPGRFEGVIGGPPCQPFSRLIHIVRANGYEPRHENLIPELERIIGEAQPTWFVMEEVVAAPFPEVPGYLVHSTVFEAAEWEPVVAGDARPTPVKMVRGGIKSSANKPPRTIRDMLRLQGFSEELLDDCPLTESGKRVVIGNGVPMPLGRAIARAVRRALEAIDA